LIDYENASFVYNGSEEKNVQSLNFTINRGECILIVGRSGCGKTSLTRLLNGLIPSFYQGELTGDVRINKSSVFKLPVYKISTMVGSVFQNPRTQFFNMDTDSEIAFGIENLGVEENKLSDIVQNSYKDMSIEHLKGRNLLELSGGEKQKIAFTSIYAMNPDIYVLDDPSSNLDSNAIDDMKRIMAFLKSQGKTILISEHRLHYLVDLVDRVFYVADGRGIEEFTREEFLEMTESRRVSLGLRSTDIYKISAAVKDKYDFDNSFMVDNLKASYGKNMILKDVSFKADFGECIGIVGRNGAGKTTLLRTICGLHREKGGIIKQDERVLKAKTRLKRSYLVMQDVNYQLFADSVSEECTFGLEGIDKKEVFDVLKDLNLYEYRDKHPNTLSGGQKQRLAVATSLLSKKDILIFDEPTSGQDFDSMMKMAKLIEKLRSQGKLIFIVSHDYEFISNTCTRILLLDKGIVKDDYHLSCKEAQKNLVSFFENGKGDSVS